MRKQNNESKYESREAERPHIARASLDALLATSELHHRLGEGGKEIIQKNQFNETALRIDIECEKTVIEAFKKSGIPIRIISEEHGQTDISEQPKFLAILDGLDGTETYRKNRDSGRYGTMLSVFSGINPKYQDYLFGGIAEHALKRVVFGVRNQGAFIRNQGLETPTHTTGLKELHSQTTIGVDEYFAFNRNLYLPVFGHLPQIKEFSAESRYVDVATGKADLALECSRKGNLEIAVAYGLIHEAGGTIVDENGEDIGPQEYLEFAQNSQQPIITAATPELGKITANELQRRRKI